MIAGYLGIINVVIGVIILLPLIILPFFPESAPDAKYFLIAGGGEIIIGFAAYFIFLHKREKGRLLMHEDAVIVLFTWLFAALFAALPFIFAGKLDFLHAFYETVSMWTTTGATMIEDITALSKLFLFFRALMEFFGGVGLILVMLSVLHDAQGMKIFNAEGHADRLLPNLARSAKVIFLIYSCLAAAGALAYIAAGMHWFDALNYAMGSVSTGGVSSTAGGIAGYDSLGVEIITMVLMFLGSVSFLTHLYILKGKFKNAAKSGENRFYIILLAAFILTGTLINLSAYGTFGASLRITAFQTVSALTTTGYQTVSMMSLLPAFLFLIIIMKLTGGQNGSTSGGVKIYRVNLLLKDGWWNLTAKFAPKRLRRVHKINKNEGAVIVEESEIAEVRRFFMLFLLVFLAGTFTLTAYGYDLAYAAFDFASQIANAGLSASVMTPAAPSGVLVTGIIGMLLGRLEIYIVIFAVYRIFAGVRQKIIK